jgi:hypothetical protein
MEKPTRRLGGPYSRINSLSPPAAGQQGSRAARVTNINPDPGDDFDLDVQDTAERGGSFTVGGSRLG